MRSGLGSEGVRTGRLVSLILSFEPPRTWRGLGSLLKTAVAKAFEGDGRPHTDISCGVLWVLQRHRAREMPTWGPTGPLLPPRQHLHLFLLGASQRSSVPGTPEPQAPHVTAQPPAWRLLRDSQRHRLSSQRQPGAPRLAATSTASTLGKPAVRWAQASPPPSMGAVVV